MAFPPSVTHVASHKCIVCIMVSERDLLRCSKCLKPEFHLEGMCLCICKGKEANEREKKEKNRREILQLVALSYMRKTEMTQNKIIEFDKLNKA